MDCNVSLALKRMGECFPFVWEGRLAPEEFCGEEIVFPQAVRLEGDICFDGSALTLTARCEIPFSRACARCNAAVAQSLCLHFSERFVRDGAEEDAYSFTGENISLAQMFWDNFWLHLPMIALCYADCKGICGSCGRDRNVGDCNCEQEKTDSAHPFAALRTLREFDKEV